MSESAYETAPATVMLAMHCAACGRPLVDAVSVESGMGPDCREKYGKWPASVDREAVNKLVHAIALRQSVTAADLKALADHGAHTIVARIARRFARVLIESEDDKLLVWSPRYDDELVAVMGGVPRSWDEANKCYHVAERCKPLLWKALKKLDGFGYGPKGVFLLARTHRHLRRQHAGQADEGRAEGDRRAARSAGGRTRRR